MSEKQELPSAGGSFLRQPDGALILSTNSDAPAKAAPQPLKDKTKPKKD